MKKLALLLVTVALLAALFCLPTAAATAIGEVRVPYAKSAPTLDGVLGDGEWTGVKTTFSKDTATLALSTLATYDEANFTFHFDMYYQWDDEYLYMAWDMHHPAPWFDFGGNYIRAYLDPGAQLLAYSEAQGNEASGAMPRCVAAVRKDGSGVFGMQQLGFANVDYTLGEGDCGLTLTDTGWIYECRVAWDTLAESVITKTGNSSATVNPEAGYTVRLNYDCYHIDETGSYKGFLTTSMDQEIISTNVWNFSKYADILLVLEDENGGVGDYTPDAGDEETTTETPETSEPADETTDAKTEDTTTPKADDTTDADTTTAAGTTAPTTGDADKDNNTAIIIAAIVAVIVVVAVVVIVIKKKK